MTPTDFFRHRFVSSLEPSRASRVSSCFALDMKIVYYVYISIAPSRFREKVPKSFPPSRTGVTAVTAVTAGAPWRFARPILRDNGRVLGLGHQVPYTHYLPWPGDQPGRPSWPWKCAYVRSTAMLRGRVRALRGGIGGKLKCDFFVLSVPAAVVHSFMSILTHPNR